MKVVLIAPPIMDYIGNSLQAISQDAVKNTPPYGLYLLAGILRSKSYEVCMADLISCGTNDITQFQKELTDADIVGISATSLSWPTANDVIKQLRIINPEVPVVLGGIHPTMFDQYLLEGFPIDYVIRGEGEIALPALCEAVKKKKGFADVPNLSWKMKDGTFKRNKAGPLIKPSELCSFSLPAYDMMQAGMYSGLSIESSRGCAFDCSFCSTSYRRSWRDIPPDAFVERLEELWPFLNKTKSNTYQIIDDEFSTNPKRAIEIIKQIIKKGLNPSLVFDSRANDLLYKGFIENIAPFANQFLIGAECGYDEGLEKVGKKTTCQKLEAAARKLYENGIAEKAHFSFILGLPWEGKTEIEKTIEFSVRLFYEYGIKILLQPYCLIPGSRLWQEEREKMSISETMYDDYGFFRNLYLWYNSIKILPNEAWEIENLIEQLQWLASQAYPEKNMIEHSIPYSLEKYFPKRIYGSEKYYLAGLDNLREVAMP